MTKSAIVKQIFGVPSLETVSRIDDSDKVAAFTAAHYRLNAKMRQLEIQYEQKASELRGAFVQECAGIIGGNEEEEVGE